MLIKDIDIPKSVLIKIKSEHKLKYNAVFEVLTGYHQRPYVRKVGGNQYMAIGKSYMGYVTVFFTYESNVATIRTAYPSSKWQIKLYKNKRR